MVEKIAKLLDKLQYKKISSNIPFISLYVLYELNSVRVVQLLNLEEEIFLTTEQYPVFCERARNFIRNKGYEDVNLISIIVTDQVQEAKKFVLNNDNVWVIDSVSGRLLIFENQPKDFCGLQKAITDELYIDSENEESFAEGSNDNVYYGGNEKYSTAQNSRAGYYYSTDTSEKAKGFFREFTPVNSALVIINIVVFIYMSAIGSTEDVDFMLGHGAMFVPAILEGREYYRFITCIFQHFGFMHLAGNMVVLLFLGDNVERAVGKIKYLILYILGGLIGSIGSFLYALVYNNGIVSAGASGAIFAVIGALLLIVIRNKGRIEDMTTLRVCVLIAYALYNGFTSQNVDMAAHLFGLMGGFLLALLLYRKPNKV